MLNVCSIVGLILRGKRKGVKWVQVVNDPTIAYHEASTAVIYCVQINS